MSLSHPTPRQAAVELLFAGALWGFGFVATQWALTTWNPAGVLLWRFSAALLLGEILFFLATTKTKQYPDWREDFKAAAPAGFLLGSFLLLQTIGLQSTTATKSGFITTLYVVFVPVLNALLYKKKISAAVLALIGLACGGTYLLMGLQMEAVFNEVRVGDVWTLASAVIAAGHIIYIGRISGKIRNAFRINNFQSLWALAVIVPATFLMPQIQTAPVNSQALTGLLILAAACSVLAFYIQVRAQKVLSDTTASMLFLLESPFAFIFAFLLMGDRLSVSQACGALLILGAALGTVLVESGPTNKKRS